MNVDACAERLRRQRHRSLMEQPARVSKKSSALMKHPSVSSVVHGGGNRRSKPTTPSWLERSRSNAASSGKSDMLKFQRLT
jgi:hypothetical protein